MQSNRSSVHYDNALEIVAAFADENVRLSRVDSYAIKYQINIIIMYKK